MGAGGSKLEDQIFDLRFNAKQMEGEAKRAMNESKKLRSTIKKCIEDGDRERAEIYAQQAIAKKQQAVNMTRIAARIEVVSSQLQMNNTMQGITKDMGKIAVNLNDALKKMDVEKCASIMMDFDKATNDLAKNTDFTTSIMNDQATNLSAPSAVNDLLREVAVEHAIELKEGFADISPNKVPAQQATYSEQKASTVNQ